MLTGKYCEHLPLYRQSEIFARQGVELSPCITLPTGLTRAAS
ncbi:transposase IS66 family protein [Escherichia coli p0305293.1]|nr:transposase IS66 family protein [Escherichia coli p0305293.1]